MAAYFADSVAGEHYSFFQPVCYPEMPLHLLTSLRADFSPFVQAFFKQ